MLLRVRQITGLAGFEEVRVLKKPGRVYFKVGDWVKAPDVVAEAAESTRFALLDAEPLLAAGEDLSRVEILCQEGQRVQKGDPLIQIKGLPLRVLRAPQNGRVVLASETRVLLEVARKRVALQAGFPGEVVEVHDKRGVTLRMGGGLVEGLWGNGKVETGRLDVAIEKPASILKPDDVDLSKRGLVVVGGYCGDKEVLEAAKEGPVRGLILASLNPDLVPLAENLPFPVMTTDGLGKRAMNSAAFKLLHTSEGRDVTVFAQPFDRWMGQRPRALIELPGMDAFPEIDWVREITPGDKVLLTLEPFSGMTGVVDQVFRERKTLPNGIRTRAARVTLENGERLIVPLVNLELLP